MTVPLETAKELLDMGARLRNPSQPASDPPQAVKQLQGAVAIHNILEREGVAYLADEVGMGKTYVALAVIALFRHYQSNFRVVVVAPRENIQSKWMKEWTNFATHNVRVVDLRMKGLHGGPARTLVSCDNLRSFVRETSLDPNREFFLRLSSFSLAVGDAEADLRQIRTNFRKEMPWLGEEVLSLRSKQGFKDNLAKAICCTIPKFDLLVIDEAHNLKHGFSIGIAARNRVIGFVFGRQTEDVDRRQFPDYGARAVKVLFLSATPIEDNYKQLWNQLDVFGKGGQFHELTERSLAENMKRNAARQFLIRRVTTLQVGEEHLTKNLYRREWRQGGLSCHDQPILVNDHRQRLVVGLIQKKVAELLNSPKFNSTFQMGMLASFESFLETTKLKKKDFEMGNFDNVEQTQDDLERQGVDVHTINGIAKSYRRAFRRELPHPKMDALVGKLSKAWVTGRKALVFLRRVASVWELKERLDLEYNKWLADYLRAVFSSSAKLSQERESLLDKYERARSDRRSLLASRFATDVESDEDQDRGGIDTFFAWFFRGQGPSGGWLSGAKLSQRFVQPQYALSTFFEENYAATLLKSEPGKILEAISLAIHESASQTEALLLGRLGPYMPRAKRPGRRETFEAVQGAAVELLKDRSADNELRLKAEATWTLRFQSKWIPRTNKFEHSIIRHLETPTFFTALRQERWSELRRRVLPSSVADSFTKESFIEYEVRRELLSTSARLGHAFLDLYGLAVLQRGSMRTRSHRDDSVDTDDVKLAEQYLTRLEQQRTTALPLRSWGAFDELAEVGANFDLIMDVNEPRAELAALTGMGRLFGSLLRQQRPTGGMTGQVSKTLIRQFRMPGYPMVLLSTDLLQEGEDLHTFCSDIYHYGLAWTPSAIEQRIGRIDRVRSKTERVAEQTRAGLSEDDKLQVYFPHLEDTVERLQVRRVLKRMHEFMRLMHEGLSPGKAASSQLNIGAELLSSVDLPSPITVPLRTAFDVLPQHLVGKKARLAVTAAQSCQFKYRFNQLKNALSAELKVNWNPSNQNYLSQGIVTLPDVEPRPFRVELRSFGDCLVVRCVGLVEHCENQDDLEVFINVARKFEAQLSISEGLDRNDDFSVKEDVLLGESEFDSPRVVWLVGRVVLAAVRLSNNTMNGPQPPERAEPCKRSKWISALEQSHFDVDENTIVCWFGQKNESRRHKVRIFEGKDLIRFEATVVGPSALAQFDHGYRVDAWRRNQFMNLVGFRIDGRGRLLAEAVVPTIGLTAEEFKTYLHVVAFEADRLELMLTGRDVQ